MYAILFRIPPDKVTTLFETDDLTNAMSVLQGVVLNEDAELIDFSGNLDGALDGTFWIMDSVKIGYPVETTV
jgi:hypothetical protein